MESIKSRVKEKINLMFERKDDESTDADSDSEGDDEDDEEEDQRKRIRYTNLAHRSMSHSLAPPGRTCSPPPMTTTKNNNNCSQQRSSGPPSAGEAAGPSAASRALNFFRRKSDPRGSNQSRLRAHEQMAGSRSQTQPRLQVPLIVHRRRSSIAMTK